jgi:hypothetical protein
MTFFNWLWWAYLYHKVIYFTFQCNLLSHILCCFREITLFLVVSFFVLVVSYPSISVLFTVNRSLINWQSTFWKSIYTWIQTGRKTCNVSDTVLLSFWRPVFAYMNTQRYMTLETHFNIYLGSRKIHCIFKTWLHNLCFIIHILPFT